MADNQYSVRVPNILEALMAGQQGYNDASAIRTGNEQDAARKQASQLWQQGDSQGALSALIAANDSKNITALGHYQQGANSVHGTPIYLQKPDGTYAVGSFDKQGQPRIIDYGPGLSPTVPSKNIDTPQGVYVTPSRITGGPSAVPSQVGPQGPPGSQSQPAPTQNYYPKDVAGAAAAHEFGKEQGDAQAKLASMRAKLPGLKEVAKQLGEVGDQATYTGVGRALDAARTELNLGPRDAAVARTKYIAMVDNQILPLLRETFGAQFTQKEGESLKVTLGDPNKSPKEKRAVLEAFIEQKARNIEATASQIRQPQNGIPPPPKIGTLDQGYRYKGGDPADPASWVKAK